jgi:ABC-type sulfate transport system permease component
VTGWLVTMCRFPGDRMFQWALLLPMAAPAYVLAYSYTDLLEYYGPVQTALRTGLGWKSAQDYWFPSVRSIGGAIVMLTLVLYPYVYLLARSAFLNQSTVTLEASRSLGCGPWQGFFKVALPMARPAIVAGLSLALLFGTDVYHWDFSHLVCPGGTPSGDAVSGVIIGIYWRVGAVGKSLASTPTLLSKQKSIDDSDAICSEILAQYRGDRHLRIANSIGICGSFMGIGIFNFSRC